MTDANTPNPNIAFAAENLDTDALDMTNEDGNSLRDLLPPFLIPNLLGYMDPGDALGLLDAHDEQTIARIDAILGSIEAFAIELHKLDASRHLIWANTILTIAENSRDLTDD